MKKLFISMFVFVAVLFISTKALGESECSKPDVVCNPDTIPPILNCPNDTTLAVDLNCEAIYAGSPDTLIVEDCGLDTVYTQPPLPDVFTVGLLAVTWIVVDSAGNADTCIQIVNILDATSPEFTCPLPRILYTDFTRKAILEAPPETTVVDNCTAYGDLIISSDPPLPETLDVGMHRIEWIAIDSSQNTGTCFWTVIVRDTTTVGIEEALFEVKIGPETVVYDIMGRRIHWRGKNTRTGIYFVREERGTIRKLVHFRR